MSDGDKSKEYDVEQFYPNSEPKWRIIGKGSNTGLWFPCSLLGIFDHEDFAKDALSRHLELLDLRKQLDEARELESVHLDQMKDMTLNGIRREEEIESLRDQLQEAKRDSERLEWLDSYASTSWWTGDGIPPKAGHLRQAIDEAMEAGE